MGSFSPLTREECKVDKGRERMQFFVTFLEQKNCILSRPPPIYKIPPNSLKFLTEN